MAVGEVRVRGLRELQRSLNKINKEAAGVVRDELKEAAEPVRSSAETLAVSEIRNVGLDWSRMRVGTRPGSVYVAPQARRKGGSPRPNLGVLLFDQMQAALDKHQGEIVERVEDALDRLGRRAGF